MDIKQIQAMINTFSSSTENSLAQLQVLQNKLETQGNEFTNEDLGKLITSTNQMVVGFITLQTQATISILQQLNEITKTLEARKPFN